MRFTGKTAPIIKDKDKKTEHITVPFDPQKIDVDIQTVNLGLLIEMLRNEEIDLQPDFQRASDLWNAQQKSRLIESILLGIPLPSFYFSDDPKTKKWAIVDGLQRICAIRDFILKAENPLLLHDLQFLHQFEGKSYKDLPREEQKRISMLKINLNVIRKDTPSAVKFVIFQRVNSGGESLKPQEMRHALNQGKPARFIKDLAEEPAFIKVTRNSIKSRRMEDRDYANRFVAFYLFGYTKMYEGDLNFFMNLAMEQINVLSDAERESLKKAFISSMQLCFEIFGNKAFSNPEASKNSVSKSIFDTLSVNIGWLNAQQCETLKKYKDEFITSFNNLFHDDEFIKAISSGTARKKAVEFRFQKVKSLIEKITEKC